MDPNYWCTMHRWNGFGPGEAPKLCWMCCHNEALFQATEEYSNIAAEQEERYRQAARLDLQNEEEEQLRQAMEASILSEDTTEEIRERNLERLDGIFGPGFNTRSRPRPSPAEAARPAALGVAPRASRRAEQLEQQASAGAQRALPRQPGPNRAGAQLPRTASLQVQPSTSSTSTSDNADQVMQEAIHILQTADEASPEYLRALVVLDGGPAIADASEGLEEAETLPSYGDKKESKPIDPTRWTTDSKDERPGGLVPITATILEKMVKWHHDVRMALEEQKKESKESASKEGSATSRQKGKSTAASGASQEKSARSSGSQPDQTMARPDIRTMSVATRTALTQGAVSTIPDLQGLNAVQAMQRQGERYRTVEEQRERGRARVMATFRNIPLPENQQQGQRNARRGRGTQRGGSQGQQRGQRRQ